jgi:hypothetical protein
LTSSACAVTFAPDGKTLASSSEDGTTRLWEADTGQLLAILQGPETGAAVLAFTADGKMLVAGGRDPVVHIWQLEVGQKIVSFKTGNEGSVFAIGLDATLVLSANGQAGDYFAPEKLRLCSTAAGLPVQEISLRESRPTGNQPDFLACDAATLSADGRMVASSASIESSRNSVGREA